MGWIIDNILPSNLSHFHKEMKQFLFWKWKPGRDGSQQNLILDVTSEDSQMGAVLEFLWKFVVLNNFSLL